MIKRRSIAGKEEKPAVSHTKRNVKRGPIIPEFAWPEFHGMSATTLKWLREYQPHYPRENQS